MANRSSYEITISSPFAILVLDKECLQDKIPPIHIQLVNEESIKVKSFTEYRADNRADF